MDLDITFDGKTMSTPMYIKMDSSTPLLLSEGVCAVQVEVQPDQLEGSYIPSYASVLSCAVKVYSSHFVCVCVFVPTISTFFVDFGQR